ncbi:GRP family sugar transporter [Aeoliella sp.]|uniref:GRP family sugar transporter n=1 Tax=Aeoliella sp. TaxID=2795800 RepID=UPI003CCC2055
MFVVDSYPLAVVLCVVTMFCWGSWANTQKATGDNWRFELFYWDYVFGVVLMSLVFAFTLGSIGEGGRSFMDDVQQAEAGNMGSAMLGGVVFNLANILLVAAIELVGMSVAFPIGIGCALIVGVAVSYYLDPQGSAGLLAVGVGFILGAIILDALAYRRIPGQGASVSSKGLILCLACGLLMGMFYPLVARSMSATSDNPMVLDPGKLSPYTAVVFFSLGVLLSNLVFNPIIMAKPFAGEPVGLREYLAGTSWQHTLGVIGGMIWCVGMTLSILAATKAGPAISYGLGQCATMIAAIWGVFIWREFRTASKGTGLLLTAMFACFAIGIWVLVMAKGA